MKVAISAVSAEPAGTMMRVNTAGAPFCQASLKGFGC